MTGTAQKTVPLDCPGENKSKRDVLRLRSALVRTSQAVLASHDFDQRRVFSRFIKCGNVPYVEGNIDLNYSPSRGSASFGNLMRCGSVWLCPECSSKIAAVRCEEIKTAIEKWTSASPKNAVYMLTLTHSHTIKDSLSTLLDNQSKALTRFWRNGTVRRLLSSIGFSGRISSLEITFGQNSGWHPHRHILLFCEKQFDPFTADGKNEQQNLEARFRAAWSGALSANDLYGNDFCLNFEGGAFADQYVTKLSQEVTLSNLKRSPDGSVRYTPFALLYLILSNLADPPQWALESYRSYALATRRKRQLVWSAGLKAYFGIVDRSDDEIADEEPPDTVLVGQISYSVYRRIRTNFNLYHEFLNVVSTCDMQQVLSFLMSRNLLYEGDGVYAKSA